MRHKSDLIAQITNHTSRRTTVDTDLQHDDRNTETTLRDFA